MKKLLFLLWLFPAMALAADLDDCKDVDLSKAFPSGGCELPEAKEDASDKQLGVFAQPAASTAKEQDNEI